MGNESAAMLEGVRVLELGSVVSAPLVGMMLADLGADVIKVERPEGDPVRQWKGAVYSPHFLAYNRNKRSIVLDLTKDADRRTLDALMDTAAVLVDNYRPGTLDKYGLGDEQIRARFPSLIVCSITGWGRSGPYRDLPAYDGVSQAVSGLTSLFVDRQAPEGIGPTISDNVTGMYACNAVLAALVERARTGKGRRLEVNMLESSMAFTPDNFSLYLQTGVVADRYTRPAASCFMVLDCKDGKLLAIQLSNRDKFFQALCEAVGAPHLAGDARFSTHKARADQQSRLALLADLRPRFLERSRDEWLAVFREHDVPAGPLHSIAEVIEDPQVKAMGSIYTLEHPTQGPMRGINTPILVDGVRPPVRMLAPGLGEHSEEILRELKVSAPKN